MIQFSLDIKQLWILINYGSWRPVSWHGEKIIHQHLKLSFTELG